MSFPQISPLCYYVNPQSYYYDCKCSSAITIRNLWRNKYYTIYGPWSMHDLLGAHREISGKEKSGGLRLCFYWGWGWGPRVFWAHYWWIGNIQEEFKAQAENTSNSNGQLSKSNQDLQHKGASVEERLQILRLVLLVMCLFKIAFTRVMLLGNGCLGNQN